MQRVPVLMKIGIKILFCGPESFTPDHNYLMGEAPNLKRFFVAAGFNSLGILSGGGAGYVMARWIVHGHPPMDVWSVNIRRMLEFQNDSRYLAARTVETLGIGYQDHWPFRQWETARGIRKSPLHEGSPPRAPVSANRRDGSERTGSTFRAARPRIVQLGAPELVRAQRRRASRGTRARRAIRSIVFCEIHRRGRGSDEVLNRIATAHCDVPPGRSSTRSF